MSTARNSSDARASRSAVTERPTIDVGAGVRCSTCETLARRRAPVTRRATRRRP
jgi:hypothetical protein